MPDGSVHPMLGTRSTALVYPSGIEALATRHPDRFSALAARVRRAWERRLVPLPSALDFANAIRLGDDAREAAASLAPVVADRSVETAVAKRSLGRAGLTVWRTPRRHVFVASSLGGVVVVYEHQADGWRLAFEDSGYSFATDRGVWLTRMPGAGAVVDEDDCALTVRARFARALHDEVTPVRLVLLRLLNLTLLRSQVVGDWFRQIVVGRLMAGRAWLGVTLTRRIRIEGDGVRLEDSLESDSHRAGR